MKMKFQTILIFTVSLTLGIAAADQAEEQPKVFDMEEHNILDKVDVAMSKVVDPDCYRKIRTEMLEEMKSTMDEYLGAIKSGRPMVRKGMHFHIDDFLKNTLLVHHSPNVSEKCAQQTRNAYRKYAIAKYGKIMELF